MRPVALLTGAGRGIGAACARALASAGYACVLMSPSQNSRYVAKEIGALGLVGSATDPADLASLVVTALERFGRIDAVVNNTGNLARITPGATLRTGSAYDPHLDGDLLGIGDDEWHAALDYYYLNVVRMARLVTAHMVAQGGGAIVNISSFAAIEPRLSYPLSTPVRTATAAFVKLYSDRYARDGIRMNNVLPGFMENRDFPDGVKLSIPMARTGRLKEIAGTVRFLLSPEAGYITGQNIVVDGGANRGL